MNGISDYALVGENNINILTDIVKNKEPEWIGFNLYRVERLHYYDNCYHMNYIPEKYANYLTDYVKK